jgi:hypothetical protein
MILTMLWMVQAEAGKLAEGFRGVAYGPESAVTESPLPECVRDVEDRVRWQCDTTIGEAAVQVSYLVDEGMFYGVYMKAKGYANAEALFTVIQEAYGKGMQRHDWDNDKLADRLWKDGSVYGSFDYNKYSGDAQFMMFDKRVKDQVETAKAERAKRSVDDL